VNGYASKVAVEVCCRRQIWAGAAPLQVKVSVGAVVETVPK
jgi:hypothetical protein